MVIVKASMVCARAYKVADMGVVSSAMYWVECARMLTNTEVLEWLAAPRWVA